MTKRKVVAYIRVSTEEQAKHGYSIEAQRQVLKDYADGHDLAVQEWYVESQSAHKPGRPQFRVMVDYLKAHPTVDGVVCYKIDRLARNLRDYSELSEMEGVQIISATESLPENASGQLMATVQAAFAKYFSDQLSERVKLGMATKAQKGLWPTNAPIGYFNDQVTKGLTIDSERAPLVQEMFEKYVGSDMSLNALRVWAKDRGLRSRGGAVLTKSTIHRMLQNHAYYGKVHWAGEVYDGVHQPLISKSLFDRAQERLRGKSHPLTKRHFAYRGLLYCGYCGCKITAGLHKGKYIYYRCTHAKGKCEQGHIREDRLSELLYPVVEGVHLSEEEIAGLLTMFDQEKEQRRHSREQRREKLQRELVALNGRKEKVYIDKLDGKISEERWLDLDRQWEKQAEVIEQQLASLEEPKETLRDDVRGAFELLQRAPELYLQKNHDEKAELLRLLVFNCKLRGETVEPIYRKPFEGVAVGRKTGNWYARRDSNPQPPVPKTGALSS